MSDTDKYGGTTAITTAATGFFRVQEVAGRWWFITPEGHGFLSLGVNHIDSAALKYADNVHIWRERYGSEDRFLTDAVRADLRDWGFNTIGWTQEVVARHRDHSPPWRQADYARAGLPYCHLIRFTEMEMWNRLARFPDVFSDEFADWCDALARDCCVDMAEDPYLIGYFYSDIPAWNAANFGEAWTDHFAMDSESGRRDFARTAERYYQVIHDAIRRYDENHLLLGDRYNNDVNVPPVLLEAMAPTVDVISLQHFGDMSDFIADARRYHALTGKPVINADIGFHIHAFGKPVVPGMETQRDRGRAYAESAAACFAEPHFIGWHWCAYIENATRQAGLKDRFDEPYLEAVAPIREFNRSLYARAGTGTAAS